MARAAARGRKTRERSDEGVSARVVRECAGVGLLGLALLLMLALASFTPADPIFEAAPVENLAGVVGASAAALLPPGASGAELHAELPGLLLGRSPAPKPRLKWSAQGASRSV